MLFNSVDFAIFLPVVFILYWYVTNKNLRLQNFLIVLASYFFYGWWDWRFLSLILFSTAVDYLVGLKLKTEGNKLKRKLLLWTSIGVNLGFLGFFKYYNFFLDNFVSAFQLFGKEIQVNSLNILLPVGISFYTFQTLSYTIDVYKRKKDACSDFFAFSAFVSFFPQLVAGPIEREAHLLPQFTTKRVFDSSKALNGLKQILWGLFKKMVIADNCAEIANQVFNNSANMNGSALVLGAVFFAFQIYGDFSGYSDIAIGTAKLFGFDLIRNFAYPYFSRDVAEFWRRWHISLSTWFRDYLYIPLGGSTGNTSTKLRNVFIIFLVSGFWHGANWTFLAWGAINAIYFIPLLLSGNNRKHLNVVTQGKNLPSLKEILLMVSTFSLITFSWIFFRAESMNHAFSYINGILSPSLFETPSISLGINLLYTIAFLVVFLIIEWKGRECDYALDNVFYIKKRAFRYTFYYALIFAIFWFGGSTQQFIYFQF